MVKKELNLTPWRSLVFLPSNIPRTLGANDNANGELGASIEMGANR